MKNGKSLTPLHCARKGFIFEFRDSEVVYVDLSQMGSLNLSIVFNLFKSVVQEFLRTTDFSFTLFASALPAMPDER